VVDGLNSARSHIPDVTDDEIAAIVEKDTNPYVDEWLVDRHRVENTGLPAEAVAAADLIVLQANSAFVLENLARCARLCLDTIGASSGGERL
jgi:hypothetical protein